MRLEAKNKFLKIKNLAWHCGFCGRKVPIKSKFVFSLYLKERSKLMVCEYWCKNCGIIARFEYQVKSIKEADKFIKKMNVYTDTLKKN